MVTGLLSACDTVAHVGKTEKAREARALFANQIRLPWTTTSAFVYTNMT